MRRSRYADTVPVQWIGWAAGMFEGEGTIALSHGTGCITISICQNDFEGSPSWVLVKLQKMFGGYVQNKAIDHRKWVCAGADNRDFLLAIYPFLSPKRTRHIEELRAVAMERTLKTRPGPRTFWWWLEDEEHEYEFEFCSVEDCDNPVRTRRWCPAHYGRWHRTGDVSADIPIRRYRSRTESSPEEIALSHCGTELPH